MSGDVDRGALKASWDHYRARLEAQPADPAVLLRLARLALALGRPRQAAELLTDRAEGWIRQGRMGAAAGDCARALVCDARSQRAQDLAERLAGQGHRPRAGLFEDLGDLFADDVIDDALRQPRPDDQVIEASALLAVRDADSVDGLSQMLSQSPGDAAPSTLPGDLVDSVDVLDGSLDLEPEADEVRTADEGVTGTWSARRARPGAAARVGLPVEARFQGRNPLNTIDLDVDDPLIEVLGSLVTSQPPRAQEESWSPRVPSAEFDAATTNKVPRGAPPADDEGSRGVQSLDRDSANVVLLRSGEASRSERAETDDAISGALFGARLVTPALAPDARHTANADVFAGLPRHVYADLLSQSGWRAFGPGEVIAQAGKAQDGLYLLVSGRAQVNLPDQTGGIWSVGEVGQDDLLGVLEWVESEPWACDVIARTRVELRVLGVGALSALRRRYPAVDRAMADEAERQEARLRVIGCALFAALSLDEQEALSRRLGIRTLIDGEALVRRGEDTEGVSLVGRGQLRVEGDDGEIIATLGPGAAVGVQAAIQGGRARWTVVADPQARLYDLDAQLVAEVLTHPAVRRAFEIQAARRRSVH